MAESEKNFARDEGGSDGESRRTGRTFRWPIRIGLAVAILAAGLVVYWLICNRSSARQLEEQIASYRAAGQPVYASDFDPPFVAEEDNAALALEEALVVMDLTGAGAGLDLDVDRQELSQRAEEFRRVIEANAEVFRLVRKARSISGADWGLRFRSPMINMMLPDLRKHRDLARLLCAAAIYHHQAGDDAAALECLRDTLAASKALGKMPPTLIGLLVCMAMDGLTYEKLEEIAPNLKVMPAGAPDAAGPGPAGRKQIQTLIEELLDEAQFAEQFQMALYGERAMILDTALCFLDGRFSSTGVPGLVQPLGGVLRPMIKRDALWMLRAMTAMTEAAAEPNYPAAKAKLPKDPQMDSFLDRMRHILSAILWPSFSRVFMLHFRAVAMRRMAATALAIRLYEIDHGRRPEKLADLVPEYLPAVPKDPFAADGRAIAYLPGAPRPLLYSVGVNETDQGGIYAASPDQPPDFEHYDVPFFLNGDRPREQLGVTSRPAPATAPAAQTAPADPSG